MPEIVNNLFGRPRNDSTTSGDGIPTDRGDVTVTPEIVDTAAIATVPDADDRNEPTAAEPTGGTPADGDAGHRADTDDNDGDDYADDYDDAYDEDESDDEDAVAEVGSEEDATDDVSGGAVDDADADEDGDAEAVEAAESDDDTGADEPEAVVAAGRPAAAGRGSTTVDDAVVAKVVNIVAREVEGVHSFDDDGLAVAVADGVATVMVSFVVEYGQPVTALAERIRIDVIEAVEQLLGLEVATVDIHVSDLHHPGA